MALVFDLPDHIWEDIFRRFSYEQSRQCLLVCRRWHSLVSDFYFVSRFTSFQRPTDKIYQPFTLLYQPMFSTLKGLVPTSRNIYTASHNNKTFLNLDFLPTTKSGHVYILKSSNDLLLCSDDLDHHGIYYICNPLSRQWVSLPPTPSPQWEASIGFYCDISYDEYENEDSTIWIINNTRFKYIVLRYHLRSSIELEIFSSKTSTWRNLVVSKPQIPRLLYFDLNLWVTKAIIYNGKLWYMHRSRDAFICAYNPDHDLNDQQRWKIIGLPSDIYACCHSFMFMGVSNGRMRISQIHMLYEDKIINKTHNDDVKILEPSLRIWEFDDSNVGEWSLVHHVYLKDLGDKFNHHIKSLRGSFFNIRLIHFHPVDADNIFIVVELGYFEYNIPHKAMKFQFVEQTGWTGREWIHRQFPYMLPQRPTPISEILSS